MSAALSKRSQNKKKASAQGSLKFREVSNSFWEATRRERVTYSLTLLVRTKCVLIHVVVLCLLQVFRSSNYAYVGKKGRRFQLCHQFLAVFLLGQDVVMAQMSLYIELDRHS